MNIASIFDWFAQDSAYAAEHTDEPRQRGKCPALTQRSWCVLLTAAAGAGLLVSLAGAAFRVGQRAARSLQKGDLPSSGERAVFIWSKVVSVDVPAAAKARLTAS
jgi:hypothetical protein